MSINQKTPGSHLPIFLAVFFISVVVNILFLVFSSNEAQTIILFNKELKVLEKDQKIIAASANISEVYEDEIKVISQVFPTEETIPVFIQVFEGKIRSYTDVYSFKFNSVTPLKEGDILYLPLTITLRIDLTRLLELLTEIEGMPYMTHVYLLTSKTPDGFGESSEVAIGLKVYVQNPFTSK